MEKREPSLVPEWLRSSGHGSGLGSSNHMSSSSHSVSSSSHNSNNRNSRSDVESGRSPFLDRSSSTNARRGSSNGSTKHAYSSFNFNRSNRDREWGREKDRLSYIDPWDHDTSVPLGTSFLRRDEEQLRRSHSMTTRKHGNHLDQRFTLGLKNGGSINIYNGDGTLPGTSPVKSSKKPGFDKDFPSLRTEERNGGTEVVRILSPGRSPVGQSLSVGNSGLIVGEGWTSALAEVPNVIEKSGSGSHANVSSSATLTGPTGRNMAEALVQTPARTGTPPQGSVKTQRLEDRAIKQSRQLIPVVPSAPKGSVLNSFDKSKTKSVIRSGETTLSSSRNTQQQSSMLLNNLQPGSQIKPDTNKKLVVLKPTRENGIGAGGSPPNSQGAASQMTTASSTQFASSVRSTNSPMAVKGASVNMVAGKTGEKKLSLSQTQSRNAFYSTLKQKTCTKISSDPSKANSSSSSKELVASEPSSVEKVSEIEEMNNSGFELAERPDEKEFKFLKSLGWDENYSKEDEPLTYEEIRNFYEEHQDLVPLLVQRM